MVPVSVTGERVRSHARVCTRPRFGVNAWVLSDALRLPALNSVIERVILSGLMSFGRRLHAEPFHVGYVGYVSVTSVTPAVLVNDRPCGAHLVL